MATLVSESKTSCDLSYDGCSLTCLQQQQYIGLKAAMWKISLLVCRQYTIVLLLNSYADSVYPHSRKFRRVPF